MREIFTMSKRVGQRARWYPWKKAYRSQKHKLHKKTHNIHAQFFYGYSPFDIQVLAPAPKFTPRDDQNKNNQSGKIKINVVAVVNGS
ncbi:uncharacterized protein BO95DRAFT_6368 [Aspergillus brunneoviolaceus CBS 621.78]|uniref:Uncharacterized protein n=1 Tax=Aspergillus brunneoviolaceus CBS 621.78 TaxID=1450534 RepID=A0ACD1GQB8_9EURO|nr:hypothetical protein BO95DRAFT_6368 [Aspergillus brunneoviolaceus CBS 621.78]RAH51569.1 hypothetical protein BO95DRAFT_6368 [Aspergillus brunneoviolaceus CBS 621.78]